MQKVFAFTLLWILCLACKTPSVYTARTFTTDFDRVLPYDDIVPKKDVATRLALLLPDNPDTLQLHESPLTQMLINNGYRVIIPAKPGNSLMQKQELDTKNYRLKDINNLLQSLDTSAIDEAIIIGIGEGGYLLPDVKWIMPPKFSIVINAGPASPLAEYENIINKKITDQKFIQQVLSDNFLFTLDELEAQINRIEKMPYGQPQLLGGTNSYWIGYKEDPLLNRIIKPAANTVWIISESYPLISNENKNLARQVCASLSYMHYHTLPGRGNFNNDDEMKALVKKIESLINSQSQSY